MKLQYLTKFFAYVHTIKVSGKSGNVNKPINEILVAQRLLKTQTRNKKILRSLIMTFLKTTQPFVNSADCIAYHLTSLSQEKILGHQSITSRRTLSLMTEEVY